MESQPQNPKLRINHKKLSTICLLYSLVVYQELVRKRQYENSYETCSCTHW